MKKVLFISVMILCYAGIKAQTKSGSFLLGGGIQYTSQKPQNNLADQYSTTTIRPSIGYFVIDKLALGVNFGVTAQKTTAPVAVNSSQSTTIDFGPFIRYYMFSSNESFAFFAQADFNVSSGTIKPNTGNKSKSGGVSFGIAPGFTYFFSKHWASELGFQGIRYISSDPNKDVSNDKTNYLNVGLNSFLPSSIGIRYYFNVGK